MSIAVPAQTSSDNLRGIGAMLAAMAAFVINDAMMKLAAAELPTGQLIFLRGLMIIPVLGALAAATAAPGTMRAFRHPGILARCVAEIGAALLYLTALFHMPIADCTAILQFTPLALTAGAALFLGRAGRMAALARHIGGPDRRAHHHPARCCGVQSVRYAGPAVGRIHCGKGPDHAHAGR